MLKALIPRAIKRPLRAAHRAYTLKAALRQVDQRLAGTEPCPADLIDRLIYGWGNEGWSAKPELTAYLLNDCRGFSGSMLECGSGLSTILMGMIAARTGAKIISLEHHEGWHAIIRSRLAGLGFVPGGVVHAPLRNFGEYSWYDIDSQIAADQMFDLVLCDGPPNSTPGGRYGLLPRVFQRLRPGAIIIVDDSHRQEEARMIQRWLATYDGKLAVKSAFPTFSVLRLTDGS